MRGKIRRLCAEIATAGLVCATLRVTPAGAQTDEDRAGARTLATEGARAFAAQRWSEAVDLFTRAEALVHAPPHLLYLARARVKLGQLVLARETYTRIVRETVPSGAPAAFVEAQTAAKAELPTIEPRIAMLTVTVTGADPKAVSITLDGQKLPAVFVGAPKPIDPGEHRVQANSDGMSSEVLTLHVREGARASVSLALVPSQNAAPIAAPRGETVAASPPVAPPSNQTISTPPSANAAAPTRDVATGTTESTSGLRIGSYVAFGVGAAGLAAGTVFGLQSMSKRSKADELCPDSNRCSIVHRDEVEGLDDGARQAQTLATVGFIAGGVGVATGIALLVLSGKKPEQRSHWQSPTMRPWIGLRAAGVAGTF